MTDEEIIDGVAAIANDPTHYPSGVIPMRGSRIRIVGNLQGMSTTVIVDPVQQIVVTAYPLGVARKP